ncbi:MAG: (Fe-S)-binding protein [Dissulfuribacterales bacterium]
MHETILRSPSDTSHTQGSRCNHCGACLAVCPVYDILRLECFSPRGRSHLLTEMAEGRLPTKADNNFFKGMDACLQCGACSASCKAGEDTASRVLQARTQFKELHTIPKWAWHLLKNRRLLDWTLPLLALVPHNSGLLLRLLGLFRHEKDALRLKIQPASKTAIDSLTSEAFHQIHKKHAALADIRIAFFVGCVQNYIYPQVAETVAGAVGASLIIPRDQVCCGMPAWTNGRPDMARELAIQNMTVLKKMQPDIVVTGCASCADMIQNHWPGLTQSKIDWQVMELSRFLLRHDIIPTLKPKYNNMTLLTHTPCHQRYGLKDAVSLPAVLKTMTDGRAQATQGCCGGGGLFAMKHTGLSARILEKQAQDILSKHKNACVVTTCSGCLLQWRELSKALNMPIETVHLAELFA